MNLAALSEPFPLKSIHWRAQGKPTARNGKHSAMALAYLDARDVMDRLDDVCGPSGWQSHFEETPKGRIICRLSIRIGDEWVTKSDGAGDTDVEGEKGALSDALKRAAVSWGVGRYLYRLESPWVACEVNDRGAWKRWTEDPWSKVKRAPARPTEGGPDAPVESAEQKPGADAVEVRRGEDLPPNDAPPEFDAKAAEARIIAAITKKTTEEALAELWRQEVDVVREIGDEGRGRILDAFKARKAQLTQKDAA